MSKVDVFMPTHEKVNVFVKPNEQRRACSNTVMARKRTFRGTRKEQSTCPLVFLLTCQLTTLCQLFCKKFNIMSTLFTNQSPTLPQKIDSREGLFWCKKGLVCEYDKMNIYFKKPPFVPHLGLFAAKWRAFWCKIGCVLVLNEVRFGTKRKAKWCKTQCLMPLNAERKA